ncbi:MAG TPA: glycosyl transferase family 1 [Clostridiaceae bacterium]|nr:glycosyl transferase family 1 [Clostridiaceae bacterium]
MRILHYSLGLPPYRTGGLTKYSYDLMRQQQKQGNRVILLFPGHYNFINHKVKVSRVDKHNKIEVYEIVNPLPVPLMGGIKHPTEFCKKTDINIYMDFLSKIYPDIIHIHTLMGLHKEFLEAAKRLKIKTVFTTHDYFGLCPKVNFIDYKGKVCKDNNNFNKCLLCNSRGYSAKLIFAMQSRLYRKFKDSTLVINLRHDKKEKISNSLINSRKLIKELDKNINANDYSNLRDYYYKMFEMIDCFHFNSSISKEVYKSFIRCKGEIVNITHSDIKDHRKLKEYHSGNNINILYIGPQEFYKGYFLLKDSLDELISTGINNFVLNVYGNNINNNSDSGYIRYFGRFNYNQLDEIFNKADLLVIPSIWKETFGFIGLEAMSYGLPVIATRNVGFKDIIKNGNTGIIIEPYKEALVGVLKKVVLNPKILEDINKNIVYSDFNYSMGNHAKQIYSLYKK